MIVDHSAQESTLSGFPTCNNSLMAATLKARAGHSFKAHVRYYTDKKKTTLVDTTGYTARLQLRATQPPARILLDTEAVVVVDPEDIPSGTALAQLAPGHWRIFLGKSLTKKLPPSVRFEVELVNDTDEEDSIPVASGTIQVNPEAVTSVE